MKIVTMNSAIRLTIGMLGGREVRRELVREQQDADREDDRDDAGLVDPQRQERLAARVHPPAADAAGVLDRDPALAFLDVDDHARPPRWRRSRRRSASVMFGLSRNASSAPGARLTMPAKMMKLMPLPMPRSVISSPIHIRAIGAGGQGRDLGQRREARQVERAGQDALRVEQRQHAVRLQDRHRDGQVAGVLVDLVAPELTLAAERLERRHDAASSAA